MREAMNLDIHDEENKEREFVDRSHGSKFRSNFLRGMCPGLDDSALHAAKIVDSCG